MSQGYGSSFMAAVADCDEDDARAKERSSAVEVLMEANLLREKEIQELRDTVQLLRETLEEVWRSTHDAMEQLEENAMLARKVIMKTDSDT